MWWRDRARSRTVLRAGAAALEVWRQSPDGGRALLHAAPLPSRGSLFDPAPLADALRSVATHASALGPLTCALESVYAPALKIDTGGAALNRRQLAVLFAHRFGLVFDAPGASAGAWMLRADHRIGDGAALVFALPGSVAGVLEQVRRDGTLRFAAWLPALAWGLRHCVPGDVARRPEGWCAWEEQDRSLLIRTEHGAIVDFRPAVAPHAVDASIERWSFERAASSRETPPEATFALAS